MKKLLFLLLITVTACSSQKYGCPALDYRNIQKFDSKPFRSYHIRKLKDSTFLVKTYKKTPSGFVVKKDWLKCCPDSITLAKL